MESAAVGGSFCEAVENANYDRKYEYEHLLYMSKESGTL
jgi:hypothetical protein